MVRLGEKHGGDAVSVVIALLAEAMLQEKGGTVEYSYRNLAHDSFTDREVARAIVSDAGEVGLVVVTAGHDEHVELRFPAWERHQAAFRKAKSRALKPTSQANVTDSHDLSQKVTNKTRQDITEQKKTEVPLTRSNFPLSFLLADLISEADPDGKITKPTRTWAVEEERMFRIDERDPAKAEALLRWIWSDGCFWRGKVGNVKKFRANYLQYHEDAVKDWKRKNPGRSDGSSPSGKYAGQSRQVAA